jgi:hypothetical protein
MTQIVDENRDPQLFKLKVAKRRKISVENSQERPHREPHFECSNTQRLGTGRRVKMLSCLLSGFDDRAYLAFPS